MLDAKDSQFYEWLPWIERMTALPPDDREGRLAWLQETWDGYFRSHAGLAQDALKARYGAAGEAVAYAERFELCQYGHCPDADALSALFP